MVARVGYVRDAANERVVHTPVHTSRPGAGVELSAAGRALPRDAGPVTTLRGELPAA